MKEQPIMNQREKIIERIKLLFNLGQSPFPHEAESAVAMAARLMDDYKISKEEIDLGIAEPGITYVRLKEQRFMIEHQLILAILMRFFYTKTTTRVTGASRIITIYGKADDVDTSVRVFNVLLGAFKQRWKEYKSTTKTREGARYNFIRGLFLGVVKQLDDQRKIRPVSERNALIVVKEDIDNQIVAFFEQQGIKEEKCRKNVIVHDPRVEWAGYVEGLNININEKIEENVPPPDVQIPELGIASTAAVVTKNGKQRSLF